MNVLIGFWEIATKGDGIAMRHTMTEQLLTISASKTESARRSLRYVDRSLECEVDAWMSGDGTISQVDYNISRGFPLVGLNSNPSLQCYQQYICVDDAIQTACQIIGGDKASILKWKIVGGWLNGRWVKELIRQGWNFSKQISTPSRVYLSGRSSDLVNDSHDALSWQYGRSLNPNSSTGVRLWVERLSPLIARLNSLRRSAHLPIALIQRADGKAVVWPAFADDSVRGVIEHYFCYATDSVCVVFGAQVGPANGWRIRSRWRHGGVLRISNLNESTPTSNLGDLNLRRLAEGPDAHFDMSNADFLETASDKRFVPSPSVFGKYHRQWLAAMSCCPSTIVGEVPPVDKSPRSSFELPTTIEITAPWLSGLPIENTIVYSNLPQ